MVGINIMTLDIPYQLSWSLCYSKSSPQTLSIYWDLLIWHLYHHARHWFYSLCYDCMNRWVDLLCTHLSSSTHCDIHSWLSLLVSHFGQGHCLISPLLVYCNPILLAWIIVYNVIDLSDTYVMFQRDILTSNWVPACYRDEWDKTWNTHHLPSMNQQHLQTWHHKISPTEQTWVGGHQGLWFYLLPYQLSRSLCYSISSDADKYIHMIQSIYYRSHHSYDPSWWEYLIHY